MTGFRAWLSRFSPETSFFASAVDVCVWPMAKPQGFVSRDFRYTKTLTTFVFGLWPSHKPGGARRDRTADPLRARQVLSQLSYGPNIQDCG